MILISFLDFLLLELLRFKAFISCVPKKPASSLIDPAVNS